MVVDKWGGFCGTPSKTLPKTAPASRILANATANDTTSKVKLYV
jgi:hypothetical protein